MEKQRSRGALGSLLNWIGALGIVTIGTARASVLMEPLPYWDLNPLALWTPTLAIGPSGSMALDALLVFCAGLGLLGEALAGRSIRWWWLALLAIGCAGVGLHLWVVGHGGIEAMRVGSSWIAALAGAVALAHLGRDEPIARVAAGVLLGFAAMLLSKGLIQVLLEHPRTVADYESNREAFLAARGWSPDSMMAQAFERRLYQAEATGWFGLANVFATLAAGCAVALAGLTVPAWLAARRERGRIADGFAGLVTMGAVAAVAALWLSHSRGGVGALVIGAILLGVGVLLGRREGGRTIGGVVGVGVIALVLVGVVLRGVIGERVGELSILFRWFYMQGAVRTFLEHPLLGVGPDGFKDAYLLHKPPTSPEDVASPHSLLLEYVATLGIFGVAWCVLMIGLCWSAGRALASRVGLGELPERIEGPGRAETWMLIGSAGAAAVLSVSIEAPGALPETLAARLAGLAAWVGVGIGVVVAARASASWRACVGAGALAVAAHTQIEVSATWVGSAAVVLAMVGLGASGGMGAPRAPVRGVGSIAGAGVIAIGVVMGGLALGPVASWEGALTRAAREASVVATFRGRLMEIGPGGRSPSGDSVGRIAGDLSAELGGSVAPSRVMDGLGALTLRQIDLASAELERAMAIDPRNVAVLKVMSRLQLEAAAAEPERAARRLVAAERLAEVLTERRPETSGAWHWLGTVREEIWSRTGDEGALEGAVDAWRRAHELDPHGLGAVERLFDATRALGREEASRRWAAEGLRIDEAMRLDELRRLPEARRGEMRRVIGED